MKLIFSFLTTAFFFIFALDGITSQAENCMGALPPGQSNTYLWSDYFSAPHKGTLGTGDTAVIESGDTVYLDDIIVPSLRLLKIDGTLVFDKCFDGDLRTASIIVTGSGTLQIGSSTDRFTKFATITLTTHVVTPDDNYFATEPKVSDITDQETRDALKDRGFAICNGAQVYLFGEPRDQTWARLDQHANENDISILIDANPDWRDGDEIVIASTDYSQDQAEVRTLSQDISSQSLTFSSSPLSFDHHGETEGFGPTGATDAKWQVDQRAEVGLLTRNILIVGEETTKTDQATSVDYKERGHIFIHNDPLETDQPIFKASWIQFKNLGVEGKVGRYPIHFHKIGMVNPTDVFVKFCTIENSINRGIVIHTTGGVKCEGNVIYKVIGRGIYFEDTYPTDTTPQDCKIKTNLCLDVKKGLVEVDLEPDADLAAFYMRNPTNLVEGNVAAGSKHYGFYYNIKDEAQGWSWTEGSSHRFDNNRAHSCGKKGFYLDTEPTPVMQEVVGFQAYKTREHGMWIRTRGEVVVKSSATQNSWFADCRAGIYPKTRGLRSWGEGHILMEDILFVGKTSNVGDWQNGTVWEQDPGVQRTLPQPDRNSNMQTTDEMEWNVLCAIENYDGYNEVQNCRFSRYQDLDLDSSLVNEDYWYAAILSQVPQRSNWALDPRNVVRNLSLDPDLFNGVDSIERSVYFRDAGFGGPTVIPFDATQISGDNQIANAILYDEDNSLGLGAGSGVYIVPYTPFLAELTQGTTHVNRTDDPNGYIIADADVNYAQLTIENRDLNPTHQPQIMQIRRDFANGLTYPTRSDGTYYLDIEASPFTELSNDEFPVNVTVWPFDSVKKYYYYVSWPSHTNPADWPDRITVKYNFARNENDPNWEGDVIYVEIPMEKDPFNGGSVLIFNSTGTINRLTGSIDSLINNNSDDHAWLYDSTYQRIVLKLTARLLDTALGQTKEDGTDVTIRINTQP